MDRPRIVPIGIALGTLVLGSVFMETLTTTATDQETREFVETIGFAISSPAGLIVLGYLADEFEFGRYFDERGTAAMFGDFLLAILGGAAIGLLSTAIVSSLTGSSLVLFVVSGFVVFGSAFAVFGARTRGYFDVAQE